MVSYSVRNTANDSGIAAGGIFYNVQPGTAAQLKYKVEVINKKPNKYSSAHQYEIFIKSKANFSFRYNALQVLLLNDAL